MALSFTSTLAVVSVAFAVAASQAVPCENFLPGHRVLSRQGKTHTFVDGRRMKGKVYNVGGCGETATFPTGTGYAQNYTLMSYNSPHADPTCITKKQGGQDVFDSFQASVVEAVGYKWTPTLNVEDIDSLPSTTKLSNGEFDTWREAAAVFGVSDGKLVLPTLNYSSGTFLKSKMYKVPTSALDQIGLETLRAIGALPGTGIQSGAGQSKADNSAGSKKGRWAHSHALPIHLRECMRN